MKNYILFRQYLKFILIILKLLAVNAEQANEFLGNELEK